MNLIVLRLALFYKGNATNPAPPTEDLEIKLKKIAGCDEKTSETRSLAVVSFLYLYGSLALKDGWELSSFIWVLKSLLMKTNTYHLFYHFLMEKIVKCFLKVMLKIKRLIHFV